MRCPGKSAWGKPLLFLEEYMKKSTARLILMVFSLLMILALVPAGALANSKTNGDVTLHFPDSYVSCKPADKITTTGVPESGKVVYNFYEVVDGSLVEISRGTVFSDLNIDFPYPELKDRANVFAVFIAVYNADGSVLVKLNGKWTVTCEKETPPPPPTGDEGCTPGYWRQAHHYDSWTGYTPVTAFSAVFEDAFPGMTLGEVVRLNGGGLNALGRHTVAALLNASSPDVEYAYTAAQVISQFNAVFPGGDYEALKDTFEQYNESFCPLN
jgi:hypothetical protein